MVTGGDGTREGRTEQNRCQVNQIDVLPDDVLLEIFDRYVYTSQVFLNRRETETWKLLVHVCRRWRSLVFQSPRRLNLRLYCSPRTPTKDKLDVWPVLPLVVQCYTPVPSSSRPDNVIELLGQSSRVCQVDLPDIVVGGMEKVLAAMQVPFPELTALRLLSHETTVPVIPIPDSFLGGSAPRLRHFYLYGIPFPGLPKLLWSSAHLVDLWLVDIPHSGYISPESLIAPISALSSLETLCLGFRSPQSRPDWKSRSLPPLKRSILPALERLYLKNVTGYLEELVARIDTPQLDSMTVILSDLIDFDYTRLAQFIGRTPTLRALNKANMDFYNNTASIRFRSRTSQSRVKGLEMEISSKVPDRQLSCIEQICNNSLPPLSTVEDLYIGDVYTQKVWENENSLLLQLLRPFATVKNLYLSKEFAPGIAATLRNYVGAGIAVTVVLPSLQNIFVEGLDESAPVPENIGQFVAAQQLSGHPIAISVWR